MDKRLSKNIIHEFEEHCKQCKVGVPEITQVNVGEEQFHLLSCAYGNTCKGINDNFSHEYRMTDQFQKEKESLIKDTFKVKKQVRQTLYIATASIIISALVCIIQFLKMGFN